MNNNMEDINLDDMLNTSGNNNVSNNMNNVPNMMPNNMNVNQNMGNVPNMMNNNNMNVNQNMGNVPNMMNNNMNVNQNMGNVPNMMNNNINVNQNMGNVPNTMNNNMNVSQSNGNNANKKMSAKEHMHKLKKHRALIEHHQKKTNKKLVLIIFGVIVLLLGIIALILFLVFGNETKHEHVEEYDEVETEKEKSTTITAGSLVFNKIDTYRYSLDTSSNNKMNYTLDVKTGVNTFSFFYNMIFSTDKVEQVASADYSSLMKQGLNVVQPSGLKLSNGKTVAKMEFTGSVNGYFFYYNFASNYLIRGVCYTEDVAGSIVEFEKIVNNMSVANSGNVSIQEEIVEIDIQDIINKKANQID